MMRRELPPLPSSGSSPHRGNGAVATPGQPQQHLAGPLPLPAQPGAALLSRVPRNTNPRRRVSANAVSAATKPKGKKSSSASASGNKNSKNRNVMPSASSSAAVNGADESSSAAAASRTASEQRRRVRFGADDEGGDCADAAAAADNNHNTNGNNNNVMAAADPDSEHHHQQQQAAGTGTSATRNRAGALVVVAAPQQPRFEPEVEAIVKRRLGQENSTRIRLTRTITQLEQELSLARKEHAKLQSRAHALPHYNEQLSTLRSEVDKTQDELESLDIEYGYYQQRYRELDKQLEPEVKAATSNKKRLESTVRETRQQQLAQTAAALQKKERALQQEIEKLCQLKELDLQEQHRLLEQQHAAAVANRNSNSSEVVVDTNAPSPARVRDAYLRKALDDVRSKFATQRGMTLSALHSRFNDEMTQLAEEEVFRETQVTSKVGEFTNKVNKAEIDNVQKKHEVQDYQSRYAQAVARLAEHTADIAVEQQRLQQANAALDPAQEEFTAVQTRLDSAKEHLDRAAIQARSQQQSAENATTAAAAAWQIEQQDLQRMLAALQEKVSTMRQRETKLAAELDASRKQRDAAEKKRQDELGALLTAQQQKLTEINSKTAKSTAEAQKATAEAEKIEQEALAIEQRLQASQKTEIIVQLNQQNGEVASTLDGQVKGNAKLDEKLKHVMAQLGDDAAML